jgi:hypothetical protein
MDIELIGKISEDFSQHCFDLLEGIPQNHKVKHETAIGKYL